MGVMQAELGEKRRWVSKERFLEGLSVATRVPGATATQLGIFLGYARGGWWGGLVAGLCFVLPAFVVMLALTIAYASVSVTPLTAPLSTAWGRSCSGSSLSRCIASAV